MSNTPLAIIILAAGKGTRMKSELPKVMHKLAGQPMIAHVVRSLKELQPQKIITVIAPHMDSVEKTVRAGFAQAEFAIQSEQKGTGHAVRMTEDLLKNFNGVVLIAYGDTPMVCTHTYQSLLDVLQQHPKCAVAVLGMEMENPTGYGRLVLSGDGTLERIVECKDANAAEKAISSCNSGVMAVKSEVLFSLLSKLQTNNASGEYYLTDVVGLARSQGFECRTANANGAEMQGINSRAQLAQAEQHVQSIMRQNMMDAGVTLIDPSSVFFSADTKVGKDTIIHPFVVFGANVTVGENVEIKSYSHVEGATIAANATIGPFARLRPGAVLEDSAHIGNFVEIKNTRVGVGAKVNHLSYVGDADVGDAANVGAGTITCNYDGFNKHKTIIGKGAFIGSNSSLVAPVSVGEGAITGAGSVITENVPANALAVERNAQQNREGAAERIRGKRKK